jgi:hypothetical protein
MRMSERRQRSDFDMRYTRCLHRAEGSTAQRKQTGDRHRIEVVDRVDDVLIVLGLEDLHLEQTPVGQFRGHPAADLHWHLADRHPRHDVQHHAALAAGQVSGSDVGPVAQLLSGAVDRLPSAC